MIIDVTDVSACGHVLRAALIRSCCTLEARSHSREWRVACDMHATCRHVSMQTPQPLLSCWSSADLESGFQSSLKKRLEVWTLVRYELFKGLELQKQTGMNLWDNLTHQILELKKNVFPTHHKFFSGNRERTEFVCGPENTDLILKIKILRGQQDLVLLFL